MSILRNNLSSSHPLHLALSLFLVVSPPTLCWTTQSVAQESNVKKVEMLSKEGAKLYKGGDYEGAIELWEEAFTLFRSPNLLYNIGRAYEKSGKPAKAMKRYTACIAAPDAAQKVKDKAKLRLDVINAQLAVEAEQDKLAEAVPPKSEPKTESRTPATRPPVRPKPSRVKARVDKSQIVVIVNTGSKIRKLSPTQVRAIFSGEVKQLKGTKFIPYYQKSRRSIRGEFDESVLGMNTNKVEKYWIDRAVRGQGKKPREMSRASLIVSLVKSVEGGIGYVYAGEEGSDVRVVARWKDGKPAK